MTTLATMSHKEEGWDCFLDALSKIENIQDLRLFCLLFLTFEERAVIAGRYLIVKALLEGALPQREIACLHKVSIAQITRGSNALKSIDSAFKERLRQLISKL